MLTATRSLICTAAKAAKNCQTGMEPEGLEGYDRVPPSTGFTLAAGWQSPIRATQCRYVQRAKPSDQVLQ